MWRKDIWKGWMLWNNSISQALHLPLSIKQKESSMPNFVLVWQLSQAEENEKQHSWRRRRRCHEEYFDGDDAEGSMDLVQGSEFIKNGKKKMQHSKSKRDKKKEAITVVCGSKTYDDAE